MRRSKPFTAKEFLPQWGRAAEPENKLDPNLVRAKMLAAFGDKVVRKAK